MSVYGRRAGRQLCTNALSMDNRFTLPITRQVSVCSNARGHEGTRPFLLPTPTPAQKDPSPDTTPGPTSQPLPDARPGALPAEGEGTQYHTAIREWPTEHTIPQPNPTDVVLGGGCWVSCETDWQMEREVRIGPLGQGGILRCWKHSLF